MQRRASRGRLALSLVGAALLRACATGVGARAVALAVWLLMTLLAAGQRPEGDVHVPANVRGYAYLLAGFAVLTAVLVVPERRPHPVRG